MQSNTKNQFSTARGFSLIEVVTALSCAVSLFILAAPNVARIHREWALFGAVRSLECSMHWGKMQAIAQNSAMLFDINKDDGTFCWIDPANDEPFRESTRHLPPGVVFAGFPKRSLRFYQHGNAAPAGTFTLTSAAGSYSVIVSPGGRIRMRKN